MLPVPTYPSARRDQARRDQAIPVNGIADTSSATSCTTPAEATDAPYMLCSPAASASTAVALAVHTFTLATTPADTSSNPGGTAIPPAAAGSAAPRAPRPPHTFPVSRQR